MPAKPRPRHNRRKQVRMWGVFIGNALIEWTQTGAHLFTRKKGAAADCVHNIDEAKVRPVLVSWPIPRARGRKK